MHGRQPDLINQLIDQFAARWWTIRSHRVRGRQPGPEPHGRQQDQNPGSDLVWQPGLVVFLADSLVQNRSEVGFIQGRIDCQCGASYQNRLIPWC